MNRINSLLVLSYLTVVNSKVFAQACDPSKEACLGNPEGILNNDKVTSLSQSINWLLGSVALIGAVAFGIKAAKKMSDEQYMGALGPGAGAVFCGISTYIAFTVMN